MHTEAEKILVVHPNQEILEKISDELKKKGYYVSVATNGLDGLFSCYYDKFSLIISAMDLQKITGFEMIRTLHTRTSHNKIPTIFIGTGQESDEIVSIAAKLNAVIMPLPAISRSINSRVGDLIGLIKN